MPPKTFKYQFFEGSQIAYEDTIDFDDKIQTFENIVQDLKEDLDRESDFILLYQDEKGYNKPLMIALD